MGDGADSSRRRAPFSQPRQRRSSTHTGHVRLSRRRDTCRRPPPGPGRPPCGPARPPRAAARGSGRWTSRRPSSKRSATPASESFLHVSAIRCRRRSETSSKSAVSARSSGSTNRPSRWTDSRPQAQLTSTPATSSIPHSAAAGRASGIPVRVSWSVSASTVTPSRAAASTAAGGRALHPIRWSGSGDRCSAVIGWQKVAERRGH